MVQRLIVPSEYQFSIDVTYITPIFTKNSHLTISKLKIGFLLTNQIEIISIVDIFSFFSTKIINRNFPIYNYVSCMVLSTYMYYIVCLYIYNSNICIDRYIFIYLRFINISYIFTIYYIYIHFYTLLILLLDLFIFICCIENVKVYNIYNII